MSLRLMTLHDWAVMDVLKPSSGNWGCWQQISFDVVAQLDSLCQALGLIPLITSGTTGKHSAHSFHYKGCAVDVMFTQVALDELPQRVFEVAQRYGFTGLGIYNQWRLRHDVPPQGGMHFEIDPLARPEARKKLWVRTQDGDLAPSQAVWDRYFSAEPPTPR